MIQDPWRNTVPYTRDQAKNLFQWAYRLDVGKVGADNLFDARSGSILFWTKNWHPLFEGRGESDLIGAVYFNWSSYHIWLVEPEEKEGYREEDVLRALGRLEKIALGEVVNGLE